jgi:hypothetical protein
MLHGTTVPKKNNSKYFSISEYLSTFFFNRLYNPSWVSACSTVSILSKKVLQSAFASGTSNPQLGGEPGI